MTDSGTVSSARILQKALELFSSRGYKATSVREICESAGLTKPTLYHFYGSKEGLYRALVDGSLDGFRTELDRLLETPGTVEERLRRFARNYFESCRSRRDLMRFMFGLIYGPPGSAPRTDFHRFYDDMVGRIAVVVEEGVARGELAPGSSRTRMLVLMGALGEALTGYLLVGHPELTPELADSLIDTILTGWRLHS